MTAIPPGNCATAVFSFVRFFSLPARRVWVTKIAIATRFRPNDSVFLWERLAAKKDREVTMGENRSGFRTQGSKSYRSDNENNDGPLAKFKRRVCWSAIPNREGRASAKRRPRRTSQGV